MAISVIKEGVPTSWVYLVISFAHLYVLNNRDRALAKYLFFS